MRDVAFLCTIDIVAAFREDGERTMLVVRDDHEKAKMFACSLPDCNHAWCKQCQQSIDFNGPEHSCDDGTSDWII